MKINNHSIKVGFSFGLTSGIITTLGMMMGVYSVSPTKSIVIGGIITIAVADAFSDALGMHISQESENVHSAVEIWQSTLSTFLTKFIFAMSFTLAFLFLNVQTAVIVDVTWGILLLGIFSYYLALSQKIRPFYVIFEHIMIAVVVLVITHFLGNWVGSYFGTLQT